MIQTLPRVRQVLPPPPPSVPAPRFPSWSLTGTLEGRCAPRALQAGAGERLARGPGCTEPGPQGQMSGLSREPRVHPALVSGSRTQQPSQDHPLRHTQQPHEPTYLVGLSETRRGEGCVCTGPSPAGRPPGLLYTLTQAHAHSHSHTHRVPDSPRRGLGLHPCGGRGGAVGVLTAASQPHVWP